MSPRLALKVDVDTYVGTVEGIPRLLDLFAKENVTATFFFSVGPDNTGKAVKRVFRKGFVKKVLSANPAASYGVKTMLYGTLLPAPDIGTKDDAIRAMREVKKAGHAIGLHAWDHVDWHDRLTSMTKDEIGGIFVRACGRFAEIFDERPRLSAAPGWTATAASVEIEEAEGIEIASDTRGGSPFRPMRPDGSAARLVEVPSNVPTLDELLAWDEFAKEKREGVVPYLARAVREAGGVAVHSIHTEIEGGRALHSLFAKQIAAWKGDGVSFLTIREVVEALPAAALPLRRLAFTNVKGRALPVATGVEREVDSQQSTVDS